MRWWFPLLLLILTLVPVPPAAGPLSAVEAAINRSEGARLRARVERVERLAAEGDPGAVDAADRLLHDLRRLRDGVDPALAADPADDPGALPLALAHPGMSESGTLDGPTLDAVALEVVHTRNTALLAAKPFSDSANGRFLASLVDAAAWNDWSQDVPASVTLAQAVLESNWGKSAPGNALFGLKGTGTAGSVARRVVEYRQGRRSRPVHPFRAYHTRDEAVTDHARLLAEGSRYRRARAVAEDPDAYVKALQGVYASDPRYASKLSDLMRRLDVLRFNVPGAAPYR